MILLWSTREEENITLPSTLNGYKDIITYLKVENIENIMLPKPISRLEEEYIDKDSFLQYMPSSEMFTVYENIYLPKIFSKLKVKPIPCMSCIIDKLQHYVWCHTGYNNKSIK